MDFTKIIKFNKTIKIEDKSIMQIVGEFNVETSRFNLYIENINKDLVDKNKEEIQVEINNFKAELKKQMLENGLAYYI